MTDKRVDLEEFSSGKSLEWAAAWYEWEGTVADYLHAPDHDDQSEYQYMATADDLQLELWHHMLDLTEGEFS